MYAGEGTLPVWPEASGFDLQPATMEPDGTLNIPAYKLPPSDFVSPEFIEAYKKSFNRTFPYPPEVDAPIEEWEKYRAEEDRRNEARLTEARARNAVEITESRIGGVDVGIVTPIGGVSRGNRDRVLLWLHGGGFFMNRNVKSAVISAIPVSAVGKIKVIAVASRQTPEFQYPAASEDVASVFTALIKKDYKPSSVGIFGCSGGSVLTGQSVAWLQLHQLPRPGAVAILCGAPMIPGRGPYLWGAGDSRYWDGSGGRFLGPWPANDTANSYFRNARRDDPGAYPGTSEEVLAKFPPTLFVVGTRAVELSQVAYFHTKFLDLGVKSSVYLMENGWHSAPLGAQGTPEGDASIAYIARWFQENLSR